MRDPFLIPAGWSGKCEIVKHGKRNERGFCPERTVNVGRDEEM
jgi:hypothetical protein